MYPFGFTYIGCLTCHLFVFHLILYFWNRFEHDHMRTQFNLLHEPINDVAQQRIGENTRPVTITRNDGTQAPQLVIRFGATQDQVAQRDIPPQTFLPQNLDLNIQNHIYHIDQSITQTDFRVRVSLAPQAREQIIEQQPVDHNNHENGTRDLRQRMSGNVFVE